jgi:RNA polymerase sigma factor (sigma-70 family)
MLNPEHILVEKCIKGQREAQKQLFHQMYGPMFRICFRFLNHREDAEDCLMKGFQKMFQNIPAFKDKGQGSFTGWLRQIMVNECLMFLRSKNHLVLFAEENEINCELPAEILSQIDAESLNNLIMQLPVGYRTVFNLFAIEGYSHKEIAGLLRISENTSKSQFSKAKLKLKCLLEQEKLISNGSQGK